MMATEVRVIEKGYRSSCIVGVLPKNRQRLAVATSIRTSTRWLWLADALDVIHVVRHKLPVLRCIIMQQFAVGPLVVLFATRHSGAAVVAWNSFGSQAVSHGFRKVAPTHSLSTDVLSLATPDEKL